MRRKELDVLSLTGKHDAIAIHNRISHARETGTESVQIYDNMTDSMSDSIADSAHGLFWDEELWVITAQVDDKIHLTLRSTRSILITPDRAGDTVHRITVRNTGDQLQIILTWIDDRSETFQTLLLDEYKITTSVPGAFTIRRGMIYTTCEGIGIQVENGEILGQLRKRFVEKQSLAVNDTFLVVISNYTDDEAVDITTMSFDHSISLRHEVSKDEPCIRYWWRAGKSWWPEKKIM